MKQGDKVKRDDGVEFTVVEVNHWSLVMGPAAEEDRIKWIGGDQFVGNRSGRGYRLVTDKTE